MRDTPDRPFDKIAIDLVIDLSNSTSGNQNILTIIDQLDGQRIFQFPTRKQTLLFVF